MAVATGVNLQDKISDHKKVHKKAVHQAGMKVPLKLLNKEEADTEAAEMMPVQATVLNRSVVEDMVETGTVNQISEAEARQEMAAAAAAEDMMDHHQHLVAPKVVMEEEVQAQVEMIHQLFQ